MTTATLQPIQAARTSLPRDTTFKGCTIATHEDLSRRDFACTIFNPAGLWFYVHGEFGGHEQARSHARAFLSGHVGLPWYLWEGKAPCA